jgi:uncharacterized membrane protein HdeD (DUF308 family)
MSSDAQATGRWPVAAWALGLALGILTVVLGVLIIAWPEATVTVVAVLFGIQLFIYGVFRLVLAIVTDDGGGMRVLHALLGTLSITVGVLVLRDPLQTVEILALLLGLIWLIGGIIEFVTALVARDRTHRGWSILVPVLTALAGVVVLAYPGMSLFTLTVFVGVGLVVWGAITSGVMLWLRFGSHS